MNRCSNHDMVGTRQSTHATIKPIKRKHACGATLLKHKNRTLLLYFTSVECNLLACKFGTWKDKVLTLEPEDNAKIDNTNVAYKSSQHTMATYTTRLPCVIGDSFRHQRQSPNNLKTSLKPSQNHHTLTHTSWNKHAQIKQILKPHSCCKTSWNRTSCFRCDGCKM